MPHLLLQLWFRSFFFKEKKIYAEVLLFLIMSHYAYVFLALGEQLTTMLVGKGFEEGTKLRLFFWQFLWGFLDNMVIRFEPFLIGGAYLYFRNKTFKSEIIKPESKKQRKAEFIRLY